MKFLVRSICAVALLASALIATPANAQPGQDENLPPYLTVGVCLTEQDVANAKTYISSLWDGLIYKDQQIEVLQGAIHILQNDNAALKNEVGVWRDAHDRVAENLVERNEDYAALRVRFMNMRNKKNYWKSLYQSTTH